MTGRQSVGLTIIGVFMAAALMTGEPEKKPVDPGVRNGPGGAGGPLKGLIADELAFFQDGRSRFAEIESVTGSQNNGLGPRFNSNQCLSCHSQPAEGGSSPARNPLIQVARLNGARNTVPWFITENGPVREARFKHGSNQTPDGEVHAIFVITGRSDAAGCNISQPNFTMLPVDTHISASSTWSANMVRSGSFLPSSYQAATTELQYSSILAGSARCSMRPARQAW